MFCLEQYDLLIVDGVFVKVPIASLLIATLYVPRWWIRGSMSKDIELALILNKPELLLSERYAIINHSILIVDFVTKLLLS